MSTHDKDPEDLRLTPDVLLRAYAAGIFPMAENRNDRTLFWVDPEFRGILPLDGVHVPRRLRRTVRRRPFEVTRDKAFRQVMENCAAPAPGRDETWINDDILRLYTALHERGHAHSVECWRNGELAGGLYGVVLKAAFFGESMFSKARDASKVALVHLVAGLRADGFTLLDTQFVTEHLSQFGNVEIPRHDYLSMLNRALRTDAVFDSRRSSDHSADEAEAFLQSITQTS